MSEQTISTPAPLSDIRKNTLLISLLVYLFITLQKPISHMVVVSLIYAMPADFYWKYLISFVYGCIGLVLVYKGLKMDEVKGSIMGFLGAMFIWDGWFELGLDFFEHNNHIPMVKDAAGTPVLLGSHNILEISGLFLLPILILTMFNKDMRCRMLLWIRKTIGIREGLGKPTAGIKPQVSRIAATEYIFVNWFMYVVMITILDPRVAGTWHPATYMLSGAIFVWSVYLLYRHTKQTEVGLMIRYAIGAAGVCWYNFEITTYWGWYTEFWIRPDQNPIRCAIVIMVFIAIARFLWTTPINPQTGKSAK